MIHIQSSKPPTPLPINHNDPTRELVRAAASKLKPGEWFCYPFEQHELPTIALAEAMRAERANPRDWLFKYIQIRDRVNARLRSWKLTKIIARLSNETPPRIIVMHREQKQENAK